MQSQFVHPGEAVPVGPGGLHHHGVLPPEFQQEREKRAGRAATARRSSKFRRLLPFAMAVAGGLVFVTLTDGGRSARQAAPVIAYVGQALERIGLGLTEVTLKGQRMTPDSDIYDRLQLKQRHSVWLMDTDAARRRIETLPWVRKASLKRVFPDRLHIDVEERVPRAVWSDGGQPMLLDGTGRVLGPGRVGQFRGLPTIFGAGAPPHVSTIVAMIGRIPELRGKVGLYEWSANRRWTLHLKSGRQILLPENGISLALMQLTSGATGRRLLDSDFEKIDLRVASQAAIEFRK